MAYYAGIWIDHHKAVVIRITDAAEELQQIVADRDSPARFAGGALVKSSYTPNDFVSEDKRERRAMMHLKKYYDEVIASLRDADAILVLGPGEAKGEFKKRYEGKVRRGRIMHVETADKMSDRQIAAHVREYFHPALHAGS